jgi:excisionase family DNA binding protein
MVNPHPFAYTVAQLARQWGVSDRHVYGLVASGELGHLKIGSAIRIRQADRDAYEASVWHAPVSPPPIPTPTLPSESMVRVGGPTGGKVFGNGFQQGQMIARKRLDALRNPK